MNKIGLNLGFLCLLLWSCTDSRNSNLSSIAEDGKIPYENDSRIQVDSEKPLDPLQKEIPSEKIDKKNIYEYDSSSPTSWEKSQDSLRQVVLNRKENTILKESFLQEFYIRNVLRIDKEKVILNIPFNLHGLGCMAPDCYSTDVILSLSLSDSLVFPRLVEFEEYEHGCVEQESKLVGQFQLKEKNNKRIIYSSNDPQRHLMLLSNESERGIAYYFYDIELEKITNKNLDDLLLALEVFDGGSKYPHKSFILSTNEYEWFLN